jgi:hypothetical protein
MERCHEDHNLVGFFEGSGFRQPLLEVAGFVDINVHHRSFDNGDRRVGATPLFSSSIDILGQKPSRVEASRACPYAFSHQAYIAEALFKDYIPDDKERCEYGERAEREMLDPRFHVTFHL